MTGILADTSRVSFIHVTDPYNDDTVNDVSSPEYSQPTGDIRSDPLQPLNIQDHEPYNQPAPAYGLEALSAAATSESYHYPVPNALPSEESVASPKTKADSRSTSAQDLSYILNPSPANVIQSALDPRLDYVSQSQPQTHSRNTSLETRRLSTRTLYKDDEEVGFLLRHFSEVPGHWMDLFDLGRFFEMEVIVKAARCPLLLYSAIALSAKSLGRLDRSSRRLREAPFPYSNAQWLHIARKYYDKAIHLLRQALEAETQSPVLAHSQAAMTGWEVTGSVADDLQERHTLPGANDDELVGTTAILCVYEFLDASGEEWSSHLDGAKSLFDITKDGVLAMATAPAKRRYSNSRPHSGNSRAAIFWNMARQDMLDACAYLLTPLKFKTTANYFRSHNSLGVATEHSR
ncbi:hypothetical protein K461DRAFT_274925 [Myriangium duriaei CBS 260.36]|uniref:Uncharacterized protein n=1 Tax=Myriangium duriaei CBS 260.36 TaxID=1168546 RepID=A0A9P4J9F7_9PEZI|nr:hypothetical protein K461DRAFT_274925 [Myriangium duriaei CBS 260.36]